MMELNDGSDDPFLDFLNEGNILNKKIIDSKLQGREQTFNEKTKVVYELCGYIDEKTYFDKQVEYIQNATTLFFNSNPTQTEKIPNYLPIPGKLDGTIIPHLGSYAKTGIHCIDKTEEGHCRELAWIPNKKAKSKIMVIVSFDPTQILNYVNSKTKVKALQYWTEIAVRSNLIQKDERVIPIFGFTTLHQWIIGLLKQQVNWRRFPITNYVKKNSEKESVDIYASTSLQNYAWRPNVKTTEELQIKHDSLVEEFNKPVTFTPNLYGKSDPNPRFMKKSQMVIKDRNLEKEESIAKACWETIIYDAYEKGASDIHILPQNSAGCAINETIVKLRINGKLLFYKKIASNLTEHFLFYAVEGSGIPIKEIKHPMDGRRSWVNEKTGAEIDMRISVTPISAPSPQVVLRLLDSAKLKENIEELNLGEELNNIWNRAATLDKGLILISGPTSSGKSTTIYTLLQTIRNLEKRRSITTVEDPIEYRLPFPASQVSINKNTGSTYASVIKQFMRNDPDTIMLGEIRDKETCEAALQLALTGHQIISTIHANSALETITRIKEFGISHIVIREGLKVVAAQRLVGKPCKACSIYSDTHPDIPKNATTIPIQEFYSKYVNKTADSILKQEANYYREKHANLDSNGCWVYSPGCSACGRTGLDGRQAVQEALIIREEDKALIENNDFDKIKEIAIKNGFRTIEQNTWELAWRGIIPINEAITNTNQLERG